MTEVYKIMPGVPLLVWFPGGSPWWFTALRASSSRALLMFQIYPRTAEQEGRKRFSFGISICFKAESPQMHKMHPFRKGSISPVLCF